MKKQTKKKQMRFHDVSEIDELSIGVFIVKKELETDICNKINELGGRVVTSMRAEGGYSISTFADIFSSIRSSYVVVFSALRKEDSKNILEAISVEFNFDRQGVGRAFLMGVEGYMGAKGPFLK